jgi:hypothetical protein
MNQSGDKAEEKMYTPHEEAITDENDLFSAETPKNNEISFTRPSTDARDDHKINTVKKWWQNITGDIYADDDPNELSQTKKNIIISIVALSAIIGPAGSMIYMPGVQDVMNEMETSLDGVNGTVAVYIVFMGIAVSIN